MKEQLKIINISPLQFHLSKNLLDEVVITYNYKIEYEGGTGRFKETTLTIQELLNDYFQIKNKLRQQNLILSRINKYREKYKTEKENLEKIVYEER